MPLELVPGAIVAKRYQLERALGQGGMGVVWSAVHTVTRKKVALKFLKGPIHHRPELRRRFLREARAASAVVHPNVLEVHDVFELDDETPVMLMDLLQGETLGARLVRQGKLSLSETADILIQVVSAVGTAHAVGVVHRDLKPDNVFLVDDGKAGHSVRVLDFGIAKLVGAEGPTAETGIITGTGSMVGTPCYMSPEQSFGEKAVDYRTDIWSLGVMFYECLTGARPVEGDSIGQVVKRLVSDGIAPIAVALPSIPPDVGALVDRMLAREREQRVQDLREVSGVLERHTTLRPPEFGAAELERPSADELPSQPSHVALDSSGTQRSTDPQRVAAGPATADAHTLSQTRQSARASRAMWGLAALVVVVGTGFVVLRPTSGGSSASGAAAQAAAPTAPAVANIPTPTTASPANPAELAAPPNPAPPLPSSSAAATAAERKAPDRAGRATLLGPRHGPPAAPTAAAPPPPAPAPVATPSKRVGGLAEKPPF